MQLLEALALSLARGDRVACLVGLDLKDLRDPVVPHPLCHKPEDVQLVSPRQLGEKLGDQQAVFAGERELLRSLVCAACLLGGVDRGGVVGEDLLVAALVAVEVQRALLDARPERVAEMLFVVVGAAQQREQGLLVDVLELLRAQAPALPEATSDPQLAVPAPVEDRLDLPSLERRAGSRQRCPRCRGVGRLAL